ncbi:hypothetical protein HMI54_007882 [Coelomomyces lativittatus]|nr:hypothetical protein HMI54_007882 [Coelomomyces lativittatus]
MDLMARVGKRLIFISNNSTKSRSSYVDKFIQLGITHVKENQVFGSAYIAAGYLQSLPFDRSKHIYVIGEAGLTEELNNLGYLTCGGLLDKDLKYENVNSLSTIETDPKIGAVLCGLDGHINYMKLAKAHTYLMDPNVLFLATNMDTTFPTAGKTFPGSFH